MLRYYLRRFKVESQLSSLIMKFDTEISDRQQYYDDLMKEYETLEKEKLQLMVLIFHLFLTCPILLLFFFNVLTFMQDDMDTQLNSHDNIMREKEEKEFAAYKEKYMKFVNNRCAKLIQRWWRKLCAKKKKKVLS